MPHTAPDAALADLLTGDRIAEVVRRSLGRPDAEVATYEVEADAHVVDNMTTAGLFHVRGTTTDGTAWRVFAKVLHPASCSPLMAFVPPEFREGVLQQLNWLDEPSAFRSALASGLPDGIRLPEVYGIDEAGPERIVLWMEHVDDGSTWDLDGYRTAARALGRAAGRWPEERVQGELGFGRRDLAFLFFGKLSNVDIPALRTDELWADPVLADLAGPTLRADLLRLVEVAPPLLGEEQALPHGLAHGDASPQNLLRDASGDVVAIDWAFRCAGPLGSDLGQLLAGRFDVGLADPGDVDAVASVLVPAFVDGVADEGGDVDPAVVERAFAIHLAFRSAISAPVIDHLPGLDDEARATLLRGRIAVAEAALERVLTASPS